MLGSVLAFVGKGIANGALGYVGNGCCGWILEKTIHYVPQEKKDLAIMVQNTDMIEKNLIELKDKTLAKMEDILSKLSSEHDFISWHVVNRKVIEIESQIQTQYNRLISIGEDIEESDKELVAKLVNDILNTNSGAEVHRRELHNYIIEDSDENGILRLWSKMPVNKWKNENNVNNLKNYKKLCNQFIGYYEYIIQLQFMTTHLLVEAYHYEEELKLAESAIKDYEEMIENQEKYFLNALETMLCTITRSVIISDGDQMKIDTEKGKISPEWIYDLRYNEMLINGIKSDPFNPKENETLYDKEVGESRSKNLYQKAEELLASAYFNEEKQNRIVINFFLRQQSRIMDFSDLNINLDPKNENLSLKVSKLKSYDYTDDYYLSYGYVKRHIFTAKKGKLETLLNKTFKIKNFKIESYYGMSFIANDRLKKEMILTDKEYLQYNNFAPYFPLEYLEKDSPNRPK